MAEPAVAQARPGYQLWNPNREKPEAKATKSVVVFLLVAAAILIAVVTFGGWTRLEGGSLILIAVIALFALFAFKAARWGRGVLPMAAGIGIVMLIFAALAAPAWFDRDKSGLSSPALNESLLGLVTIILIPVLALLIVVALIAFGQNWNVEEERPMPGHPEYDVEEAQVAPGGPPTITSPSTRPAAQDGLGQDAGGGIRDEGDNTRDW
ncbi:MAG: hypothetical protein ACR2NA_06900 [Solirubrobacterales bacterium]